MKKSQAAGTPHIIRCEDDSILIEWIFANERRRFGISVEPNAEETSWYFVGADGILQGDVVPPCLAKALTNLELKETK